MKFEFDGFSCDVDIFHRNKDVLVRFYDSSKEQDEGKIMNYVVVEPGFGYIILKAKGEAALLSGFLDENVFKTDDLICAAIEFVENLSPELINVYTPYHVDRVKLTSHVEYNGED